MLRRRRRWHALILNQHVRSVHQWNLQWLIHIMACDALKDDQATSVEAYDAAPMVIPARWGGCWRRAALRPTIDGRRRGVTPPYRGNISIGTKENLCLHSL